MICHSSNIIEWHFNYSQSQEKERLAFFYCSEKRGERTTSLEVLRSFIAQLIKSADDSTIIPVIEDEYKQRQKRPIEIQECLSFLTKLISGYENVTFIIDALDECEDADELLLHLRNLYGNTVKFFFASRHQVQVGAHFTNSTKRELDLSKNLTAREMENYVISQVKKREILGLGSRLLNGSHPELEELLIKVLINHAQGM